MGLFKNSHFLFFCDKLIHQPGFILGWGYVALRKLFESHSISRIGSLTFVPAAVGSWRNLISEEGSTVYEICYHCCVSQFHLASIPSVSATHTKKVRVHIHTHTKLIVLQKKAFSFLILDLFWSPGVFCYPMWRIEHWLQPRFALQPQPFWTSLLGTVLFMKRNYLNPQEQEVSSLYFFLDFQ